MVGDIPNDEDDEEPDLGRGMLGVSMDEAGIVQMEHIFTRKTFEFAREDLDEVIGVLASFRVFLEAEEEGGELGEENGRL